MLGVTAATKSGCYMKIKLFAGHHEAAQALVLSITGVAAILMIANLILMTGIDQRIATANKKATKYPAAEVVQRSSSAATNVAIGNRR
jgi:hypothetical protein